MIKVTIVRHYRNSETLRQLELSELVSTIQSCESFRGGYQEDEGSFIKIGQILNRPDYKFESQRKNTGWVYWMKNKSK